MVQQKQITIIIEDDLTIQILEKRVVELEGYAGLTASNAEEALPLLAEQRPALVLLNLTPSGC